MKKIITALSAFLLIFAFISVSSSQAKSKKVKAPAVVLNSLSENFNNIEDLKWELEKNGNYEAEFEIDGVEYSAEFDKNGKMIESEHEISTSDLPEAVTKNITSKYPDFELDEAELLESGEYGKAYEVKIEKEDGDLEIEIEIIIDANGKILKEEKEIDD